MVHKTSIVILFAVALSAVAQLHYGSTTITWTHAAGGLHYGDFGAAAPPETPSLVPGYLLRWSATNIIAANGYQVNAWTDLVSGIVASYTNGPILTNATLNGKQTVFFPDFTSLTFLRVTNAADRLALTNRSLSVVVLKRRTLISPAYLFSVHRPAMYDYSSGAAVGDQPAGVDQYVGKGNNIGAEADYEIRYFGASTGGWDVATYVYNSADPGAIEYYQNTTAMIGTNTAPGTMALTNMFGSATNKYNVFLGARYLLVEPGQEDYQGNVAEYIFYPFALSSSQVASNYIALTNIWGNLKP